MNLSEVYQEQTPLSDEDCFVVFERRKTNFSFPVHIHPEYEINFVSGASGAHRVIGDSMETIGEQDLVFIANPQLSHAWMDGDCRSNNIHEITIQFHPELMEQYLNKNQFKSVKRMIINAGRGICFGSSVIEKMEPLLQVITMEKDGFYAVMKLLALLYELSKCTDYRVLSNEEIPVTNRDQVILSRLHAYTAAHLSQPIRIDEVATELNMSRSTFARFLHHHLQINFSDYLLDRRINTAVIKLKAGLSNANVAEECGFNSISYFYRVFKKVKGINPTQFRNNCKKQQFII